jgi:uncharacterized membrane protein
VLLPAVLVGIGIAGTVDEVLLHQLLNWHHFYTDGESVEMWTDGVFHLLSTGSLVTGLVMLWRRGARPDRTLLGGILVGAGAFNLYDGTIQHKLLKLHEVREGEPTLAYDAVFIGVALAVLLAGVLVLRKEARPGASQSPR